MRLITFIFLLIAPSFVWAELFFSGIDKEKLSKIMVVADSYDPSFHDIVQPLQD